MKKGDSSHNKCLHMNVTACAAISSLNQINDYVYTYLQTPWKLVYYMVY